VSHAARFVRTVLPEDPWQVVFLCGLVCLTVSPHLVWLSADRLSELALPLSRREEIFNKYWIFSIGVTYAMIFVVTAGYFACLWPGKNAARRVFLWTVLPTFSVLTVVLAAYCKFAAGPKSLLDNRLTRIPSQAWLAGQIKALGPAFHYGVAGFLLVAIFAIRLALRQAQLPISVVRNREISGQDSEAWKKAKRVIWLGQGAPILLALPFALLNVLVIGRLSDRTPGIFLGYYRWMAPLLMVSISIWILFQVIGKENADSVISMMRFPRLQGVALGLAIPVGLAALIFAGRYGYDRAAWARELVGIADPPLVSQYLKWPVLQCLTLFFAAFQEEFIFRGILQTHFVRRYGLWRGIFFVNLLWGASHFFSDPIYKFTDAEVVQALFYRLAICLALGFVLGWLTLKFESLWPAVLAHGLYNIALTTRVYIFTFDELARVAVCAALGFILFRYWPIDVADIGLQNGRNERFSAEPSI